MGTGIGQLIKSVRTYKNVAQNSLSNGICAASALARYEAGTREMDGLTFIALMHRLGFSADGFEFMVDTEEYSYYRWRYRTHTYIKCGDWIGLEEHRHYERKVPGTVNGILHSQYEFYIEAVIHLVRGKKDRFCQCIDRALGCTVANSANSRLKERLGIGYGNYRYYIINHDSRAYILMKKLEYEMKANNYDEANKLLEMISASIDISKSENIQYIRLVSAIIRRKQGEIAADCMIEECKDILNITVDNISRVRRFLTRTELELFYQMTESYHELGRHNKVETIINIVVHNRQKKSSIYDEYARRTMIDNIVSDEKESRDENTEEYIEKGMKFIRAEIDVF